MFQLESLALSVHSLYLSAGQPDDAVRALQQTADLLLQDRSCPEDGEHGLSLLYRALNTLVTSTSTIGQHQLNPPLPHQSNNLTFQASNQVNYISLKVLQLLQSTQEVDILIKCS